MSQRPGKQRDRAVESPAEPEHDASELPEGWAVAKLRDLTTKVGSGATPRGGSESYHSTGVPLIRSMNVRFEGFTPDGLAFLNAEQAVALKEATVKSDDVLLNITGASIGRVTQVPKEMDGARVNQHVCIIRTKAEVDLKFLARYLSSPSVQRMIWSEQYGVTRQALTNGQILDFDIPLPPLAEQRRIVAKLEELLGKVSSSQQRLSRVPGLLKRFRQSALAAACSGRLTADWREQNDNQDSEAELRAVLAKAEQRRGTAEATEGHELLADAIPSSWQLPRIEDVFRIIDYRGRNPEKAAQGKRLITAKNIRMGYLSDKPVEFVSDQTYAEWMTRGFPRKGDIFFVTEGATMGFVALNDRDDEIALAQRTLTLQPFDGTLSTKVFASFMMSKLFQELVILNATGSAAVGIKGAKFRGLVIPFPPLSEQQEIVRRVEKLFAFADQIEARLTQAQTHVDRLTQSLLRKAFRGELAPPEATLAHRDGRKYESAVALLQRIRQQSEAKSPSSNPPPRTRTKRSVPDPSL